ncbi:MULTISPECIES: hypothetical protein [Aneurinibacillus]|uniref:CHAT domain-containing protein n=1 Tax=Aneurinibacillus thermoaerophilus TaxID=143495 RepID=A0ABX8Y8M0_ANETH|nr:MULTISPECIES: hypothetical protein [Aneurinibacillus]AMA72251.1 hypothetical protein ACH33_04860 [Aneurinibacillus sp. XH2]MED0738962.1 hypothetical protein [Aneurinibacillus thermoaerophilus]MED0758925.1 hypothetical protein [Aneurinibacillus thermoaerophilus]MED0762162.1 hypothetical protein [Aneurinibacillus thermoaerophilus]QYY41982.1 CHAT domain-containing protein [Aneurinibacillus thermoaerophilus]
MWNPVDTRFYAKKLPVAIAAIGDGAEANYIRTLLEQLDVVTLLHAIGTPDDFLQVISQNESAPPYLIISAHGDKGGLIFGEYIEEIDVSSLQDGVMRPPVIAEAIRLPGTVVINTACSAGVKEAGEAFMKGEIQAYIAADEDVTGETTALFLMHFFYRMLKGSSLEEAWEHAASYDEESRLYRLYLRDGIYKVGDDGKKQIIEG